MQSMWKLTGVLLLSGLFLSFFSGCPSHAPKEDKQGPDINISSPAMGSIVNDPELVVEGTASDAAKVISVTVRGKEATLEKIDKGQEELSLYKWKCKINLSGGENIVEIIAFDASKNINKKDLKVTFQDKIPPKVEILKPKKISPGANLTSGKPVYEIEGEVTDQSPVTLTIAGRNVPLDAGEKASSFKFKYGIPLVQGENKINVIAKDNFGNTSSPFAFSIGYSAPVLEINPNPARVVEGKNVFLKVTLVQGEKKEDISRDLVWDLEQGKMEQNWYQAPKKSGQYKGKVTHEPSGAVATFTVNVIPVPPEEIKEVFALSLSGQPDKIGTLTRTIKETDEWITEERVYQVELLGGLLKQSMREFYKVSQSQVPIAFEYHERKVTPEGAPKEVNQKCMFSGDTAIVTCSGEEHKITWKKEWVFPIQLEKLLFKKGVDAGKRYTLPIYFPYVDYQKALEIQISVGDEEEITYKEDKVICDKLKLNIPGTFPLEIWIDKKGNLFKETKNMGGITLTAILTQKER